MNLIAAYANSTGARGLNALKQWALIAALALSSAAHAGYVKIANDGTDLPDSATQGTNPTDWACTLDTATGLVWEVKTTANMNDRYTNFDSIFPGGTNLNLTTNSIGYANAVNTANLCGAADWRRPSKDELLGLVVSGSEPTINTTYFPNTPNFYFWSGSSPDAFPSNSAWTVYFFNYFLNADSDARGNSYSVRLVRGGQSFEPLTVFATGTGSGTVSRSSGTVCTSTNGAGCNSSVMWPKRGSSVTLTATPASGSAFTGWGGACSGTVGTSCTVTMDAAKGVSAAFTAVSTSSIVIDPLTPATLYAGLDGGGVYASTDSSANWSAINGGLTNLNVRALALQNATTLFAATYDGGVFKGTKASGSWSWAVCDTGASLSAAVRLRSLAVDASGTLYAGSETGVFRNTADCGTWTAQNTGMP